MTTLDWVSVQARYRDGAPIAPLAGNSRMTASLDGEDAIRIRQRLWRALITRQDLETALTVLDRAPKRVAAVQFAEHLRAFYTSRTDCSRIPNLSAGAPRGPRLPARVTAIPRRCLHVDGPVRQTKHSPDLVRGKISSHDVPVAAKAAPAAGNGVRLTAAKSVVWPACWAATPSWPGCAT
jgi:hypothetical protein